MLMIQKTHLLISLGALNGYPYCNRMVYESFVSYARKAYETNTTVKGIHPPGSCIMLFPNYDTVKGTGVDYMPGYKS
jgi:hypothetical protein